MSPSLAPKLRVKSTLFAGFFVAAHQLRALREECWGQLPWRQSSAREGFSRMGMQIAG